MYNMPMHNRCVPLLLPILLLVPFGSAGCGAALQSSEIKFTLHESPVLVKETGAIIVAKRQVGRALPDGKVVDSFKKPLAFLREDSIRIKGGIVVRIKEDSEGTVSLSKKALEKANLKPVRYSVRKNGTMASTKNARGIPIKGAHTVEKRRLILLLLLLTENEMWR